MASRGYFIRYIMYVNIGNGCIIKLVKIPGGKLPTDEEKKVDSFWIGKYLITQRQWVAVMDNNPSHFKGLDLPVESVYRNKCVSFCKKLSLVTNLTCRLPSEIEWEYACRAGSDSEYFFGDDEDELVRYAWCHNNSGGKTHPVGELLPNRFGLYDILGNVWEYCDDSSNIVRGGSWYNNPWFVRCATRSRNEPDSRAYYLGFRVVVSSSNK
ncbi:MAG: formylglycine-generating enzyme family protein [bacterium]|nr:formylglycine-generating enzyme family protein [bacterium]